MDREILFKVWDKVNKKWVKGRSAGQSLNYDTGKLEYTYHIELAPYYDWEVFRKIGAFPANYEWLQFTGLYDANKKRIFEGDIVSWNNKTYKVIEEDACFFAISESNTHWKQYLFDIRDLSEVIGNTHDNPELMEVKNG
jgi:uncharacterized phage protein (TIGR01671 family)